MVQNEATPLDTKAILRFLPPLEEVPVAPSEALEAAESAGLLQAVSGVQQLAFLEVVANQLQAHRHAARAKAGGHTHARQTGQ